MADFDNNRFASKRQDWNTPDTVFAPLHAEFNFEIDLAADEKNAKVTKFYSVQDDALSKDWQGICWLNPPYGKGDLKLWVKKAYEESEKNRSTIVVLIPSRTNTNWWHNYCMKAWEIRFVKGRPKFLGNQHGLPQPLAIVIFRKHAGSTEMKSFNLQAIQE